MRLGVIALVSYDFETQKVVDWDYLFRPECFKQVLDVFCSIAPGNTRFRQCCPIHEKDIPKMFALGNGKDNDNGKYEMPQPGLGANGIIFSFQPYVLSNFSDGVFHFTVPYERLKPCFTNEAKRLLGMDERESRHSTHERFPVHDRHIFIHEGARLPKTEEKDGMHPHPTWRQWTCPCWH